MVYSVRTNQKQLWCTGIAVTISGSLRGRTRLWLNLELEHMVRLPEWSMSVVCETGRILEKIQRLGEGIDIIHCRRGSSRSTIMPVDVKEDIRWIICRMNVKLFLPLQV